MFQSSSGTMEVGILDGEEAEASACVWETGQTACEAEVICGGRALVEEGTSCAWW